MPVLQFTLLTAAGSAIWNTIFVMAGYYLGEQYHLVEAYMGVASKVVLGLVLLAVAVFVAVRLIELRKARKGRHALRR